MSTVQEMCIIPKNLLQNLIESKEVNILRKNIKPASSQNKNNNKINLEIELKRIIKSKNKLEKALDLYNWTLRNVEELELLSNGDVLSPIKNINLLTFIQDVYSTSKTFPKDTLNLYKVWVSYINLPDRYIENRVIKHHIFPNLMTDNESHVEAVKNKEIESVNTNTSNKRKLSFSDPTNISKKNKNDIENKEKPSSPASPSRRHLEKFINKYYHEAVSSPVKTRSRSVTKNVNKSGHGVIFTKRRPIYKWINY